MSDFVDFVVSAAEALLHTSPSQASIDALKAMEKALPARSALAGSATSSNTATLRLAHQVASLNYIITATGVLQIPPARPADWRQQRAHLTRKRGKG